MGQKWGRFPDFDYPLIHENGSVGQKQYMVPVCNFHQNQMR